MLFFGKTDIGAKRSSNQDSFSCRLYPNGILLCAVCDGMGGAAGGNIASSLAISSFCGYISRILEHGGFEGNESIPAVLESAVSAANTAVSEKARVTPELRGMGTTLCAAMLADETLHVVNVGDSRLYVVNECDKKMMKITHDHSYVQYLVDIGELTPEEAAESPRRNMITRAVGSEPTVESDYYSVGLKDEGTYVLICSDGLTNYMTADDIRDIITARVSCDNPEDELTAKASLLIDGANRGGGGDNITAVLIKY